MIVLAHLTSNSFVTVGPMLILKMSLTRKYFDMISIEMMYYVQFIIMT